MSILNSAKQSLSDTMDMFNRTIQPIASNKIVNTYVYPLIALLLVLYVVMAAPKLPKSVLKFFDHTVVKIIYMFLIVFLATKNPSLAIIMAVLFFVILQTLSEHEAAQKLVPKATTDPSVFQNLLQKAVEYKNAAANALYLGDNKAAEQHIVSAAKLESAADSLNIANVHKKAAMDAINNGDKMAIQDHIIMALKHDMNAKNLESDLHAYVQAHVPAQAHEQPKCNQQIDELQHSEDVIGYNSLSGNEDYGHTSCAADMDLEYNGCVEPSRQLEHFMGRRDSELEEDSDLFTNTCGTESDSAPEHFINLNSLMSVGHEFNDMRSNLTMPVHGIRKYRDNDLNDYAPFNASDSFQHGNRGIVNRKKVEHFAEDVKLGGACNDDDECADDYICTNKKCAIDPDNEPEDKSKTHKTKKSEHFAEDVKLGGDCNDDDECADDYICTNKKCAVDPDNEPEAKPKKADEKTKKIQKFSNIYCKTNKDCIGKGMHCMDGVCVEPFYGYNMQIGMMCQSNQDCASNKCAGICIPNENVEPL